jgi:hypothetical protein
MKYLTFLYAQMAQEYLIFMLQIKEEKEALETLE